MKRFTLLLLALLAAVPLQADYVKNVAAVVHFNLLDATDGSLVTSGTPVIYITKDGGTQAAATNAAVHEGGGQWSLSLTATELNATTVGVLITESGSVPVGLQISTITLGTGGFADQTTAAAIKTKTDFFPSATAGAAGGVLIAGSNAATTFSTLTTTGALTINGTGMVAQTGDSFARIGATGSGLTSLATQSSVNAITADTSWLDLTLDPIKDDLAEVPTNAELATALDALPTDVENAAAVIGATAAGAAGTVGKILADYAAVKPATTIAAADDVGGGGAEPISPLFVNEARKWKPDPLDSSRASNVVTVNAGFSKTLAMLMPLNPEADIDSVDSVTITGPAAVAATNLRKSADGTEAHFDLTAPIATTGIYTVEVTVTTVDDQELSMRGRLAVK